MGIINVTLTCETDSHSMCVNCSKNLPDGKTVILTLTLTLS